MISDTAVFCLNSYLEDQYIALFGTQAKHKHVIDLYLLC